MNFRSILIGLMLATAALAVADVAFAGDGRRYAARMAERTPWHGSYYHTPWGRPVALVVPPTAGIQTDWGWGVGTTRISRINHQFDRAWPGANGGEGGFAPTPHWPSDTRQLGVYYIRGPW